MTSVTYSINRERTNVIMGGDIRTVWGQDYITDLIGDVRYRISPLSFFQVNPVQTEKLYGAALEFAGLTGKETVWISTAASARSRFPGAEGRPGIRCGDRAQAIEDAKKNATLNGITNASFYVEKRRKCFRISMQSTVCRRT